MFVGVHGQRFTDFKVEWGSEARIKVDMYWA